MRRWLLVCSLLVATMLLKGSQWGSFAFQVTDPEVEAILDEMTPQQRVGQLFLLTYSGSDVAPPSDITNLITEYGIGGVVLQPENGNFNNDADLREFIYNLSAQLQTIAASAGADAEGVGGAEERGVYIPLFIGLEHSGSGWPTDYIPGVSPVPSNMSIGATWQPSFAEQTGSVVGQEMSALGFNLLLGPTADVVESPQPATAGDQGERVFGGEPFWVAQMTAAYVLGVHSGSDGRVAVVPRHFPGYGSADRLASVEVPTVRRTLDQLIQTDLQPFFAVTDTSGDPLSVADGLMTGHIRYLGFQGDNPRQATRPISLDPFALGVLLQQEPVTTWYAQGGLLVTDALGQRGIRRFYDPTELTLRNRRIAQDALLAGNDVLFLGDFRPTANSNQTDVIVDTLGFFVQAYQEDPTFRQRVDAAVRRILRKKLDLYGGDFSLENVIPPVEALSEVGGRSDLAFQTAQAALTLVSPDQAELVAAPGAGDNIVIFTDARTITQCPTCTARPLIAVDALQSAILRLYGPQASGLVSFANLSSFTFEQLDDYLSFGPLPSVVEGATPVPDLMGIALDNADWVVFVMQDTDPTLPYSRVVSRFLAQPPVSADTQMVLFAMGAPYYLDSTEISKLAAMYALYDNTTSFIDLAARALFQQAAINGASPVAVSSVGYNIIEATSPNPNQVITLALSLDAGLTPAATGTPTSGISVRLGDAVTVSTGIILDRNGHPVPDGTPVEFALTYFSDGLRDTISLVTMGGVARTNIVLERAGSLEITASSAPAMSSTTIRLTVPDTGPAIIDVLDPEITPSITPRPTQSTDGEVPEVTETPAPQQVDEPETGVSTVNFGHLFFSILGLVVMAAAVFVVRFARTDFNSALLYGLSTIVVGLIGYNYYALLLPGATLWLGIFGRSWAAPMATWSGGALGFGLVYLGLLFWDRWAIGASRTRNQRGKNR